MHAPGKTRRWLLSEADRARLARAADEALRSEPGVVAAYLYGSAARGENAVDLDIALMLDAPLAPDRIEELASTLQVTGAPSGPLIDLRPLMGAGPRFQVNVIKEGRVLFERSRGARLSGEARIMSCWADFKPTWERMRARMRERWLHG
jgi:predicted nucleotidyltransferase